MNDIIQTKYGKVEGTHGNNAAIMVYKGIPYARPPVGKLRFMPPQEPEKWDGVRRCREFSRISLQPSPVAGVPFSEFFRKEFYPYMEPKSMDSLYLNIWTTAQSKDDKLPVMFWIHGGGLSSGYGHEMEFDGEAIAKKNVILVTSNFRLGYVGFFAHPELSRRNPSGTSGNNTLLDQIMALRWVKENIRAFGGDPDNVTIFGQSGGAAATLDHLCSPLSEGLVHKAIVQSGVSGVDLHTFGHYTLDYAEKWGVKVCEVLGLTLEELTNLPEEQLMEKMQYAEANGDGEKPAECMDGYVLPFFQQEAGEKGLLRDVPIMSGGLSGDKPASIFHIPGFEGRPEEEAAFKCFGSRYTEFVKRYPIAENAGLYRYMIEREPFYDMVSFGEQQSAHSKIVPYTYYFDAWIPGVNESGFEKEGTAYHSAELWFVFGTLNRCWRPFDGRYYDLSEKMVNYWTNFARSGNPNGNGLPVWKPYLREHKNIMRFNENVVSCVEHTGKELEIITGFLTESS